MNRQLSELSEMISADELNDAIDDRNFPQSHLLSRGRNNSVCSNASSASENRSLSNGNSKDSSKESEDVPKTVVRNGFMKREHPTSLNLANGNAQDKSSESITMTTTPRTSTTPGVFIIF